MRDRHRVVALLLGLDDVADQVAGDAELRDGVGRGRRRRGGVEGRRELGIEDALEMRLP
jgi:hypothetical protein